MSGEHASLDQLLATDPQRPPAGSEDVLAAFLGAADPAQALRLYVQSMAPQATRLNPIAWLSRQIALIDERINRQLNLILHHPRLQQLEARWRGLRQLTEAATGVDNVRIRVLDISWREICRDLDRAVEFDQSQLFHLVYSGEFGIPGGEPFGVLLSDFQVAHRPYPGHDYDDVAALRGLAQIASAAFAPMILQAAPQLFGLDDFGDLNSSIRLDALFSQQEYIAWRSLRAMEDSRFLAVTLPGVLARHPYTDRIAGGLHFREECAAEDGRNYLWASGAFAFGSVLIREFADVGWFSHIHGGPRDHLGGGLVTGFPALPLSWGAGQRYHALTPVLITDTLERELMEQGLMALCHNYETPFASFHNNPSLHQTPQQTSRSAQANARISAMLQQILCASRFAHYIKLMIRDKVGSFVSADGCRQYLQKWLEQYVSGRDDLSWEMRARYPLRNARVEVAELPGKSGSYSAIIYLKPHYVADQLVSELRLTTELTQMG